MASKNPRGDVTHVAELKAGEIETYLITPEGFGLERADLSTITANDADDSAAILKAVLDNTQGPTLDIVLLNAGAAVYAAGLTTELIGGVVKAREVIESGVARDKLDALIKFTQKF